MEKLRPLILVNFKKVTGNDALNLVKKLKNADIFLKDYYSIAIALQPKDLSEASKITDLPLFLHDIFSDMPFHKILRNYTAENRIYGVLLNHPENKLFKDTLSEDVYCSKKLNLKTIIASTSISEAAALNEKYLPDYIVIENIRLIGQNISIEKTCPMMVENAVLTIPNRVLFGAGVRSSEDIKHILKCGGAGALVSSVIVGANDPERALAELLQLSETNIQDEFFYNIGSNKIKTQKYD